MARRIRSKFILKGNRRLVAQLRRRTGVVFERVKRVQNSTARDIITESNEKVPKLSYDLVRSARIQEDQSKKELRTIGITYNTDYAMQVHEDLEAKHKPGTEAKFLEKPTKKQRRRYARDMKSAMTGGLT